MVKDDERREVARRLRDVHGDVIPGTKTEVHPIAGRIIGVACGYDLPDFQGLLGRLADLIEPSEQKVKCIAEVKIDGERLEELVHDAVVEVTGIDRDALLALADDLDRMGDGSMYDPCISDEYGIARRIREALGVQDV